MEPVTGYAMLDGQRLAYQVIGDASPDLIIAPSWFASFDMEWDEPRIRLFLQQLASMVRVIRFDRRGSGASDPLLPDELPPWEAFAEDIACVADEVGVEQAVIYADGDTGPVALLFAATHPDRVKALVLFNTSARFLADDDYAIGWSNEEVDGLFDILADDWGTGEQLQMYVPSQADDRDFQRWMGRMMRAVTTPSSVRHYMEGIVPSDARAVLDTIKAPTLILHPTEGQIPSFSHAQYLADNIPNSKLVALDGPPDAYPYFALADQVLPAVAEFLTGARTPSRAERILATVVFTDIVSSTELARKVGDRQWRDMLDLHDEMVRRDISEYHGQLIKNTGDGILATFEGPGKAVAFATTLQTDLARAGLHLRTGIHTGEIERRDSDIGGVAVHLGARIMAAAQPDEILVSRTVKDLVIGSQLEFDGRGPQRLKGIDGEWELFSVVSQ